MKMVRKMTMTTTSTTPHRGLLVPVEVLLVALLWFGRFVSVHAEQLTSTSCPSLRWAPFPARLDLYYFYLIEFVEEEKDVPSSSETTTPTPDLDGIARAIAVGLLDTFQGCNAFGEPVHGVQLVQDAHRYSTSGTYVI
jgi:hypothetical protein